ncbi:hypothetical protein ABMA32_07020 [Mesorhizobium sp. VNQ89]|uniref:hypothetical protein n=1 Tax=Mesorhizobium quangtriensis TaxID=3157709 RepID=UPI0032B75EB0
MKTRIYLPPVPLLSRIGTILARAKPATGHSFDPVMSSHLLRDIGLRRVPEGPDGRNVLPF